MITTEKSADGIVGGTVSLKARTLERRLDLGNLGSAMRLKSRSLAFGAAGKGEARTAPLKEVEAETTESII